MRSKAGRRRGEAGTAVVAPPLPAVPPPSFDPALLARPLRRGHEVERFNELARRQAELSPAESDELYAYRLRRLTARERGLERALVSGTEEELRNAISERERRLAEVRSLEELRREAGLPGKPCPASLVRAGPTAGPGTGGGSGADRGAGRAGDAVAERAS